jgi:hypothetical protein
LAEIVLDRAQVACLLANGFFCCFNPQPYDFPFINFTILWSSLGIAHEAGERGRVGKKKTQNSILCLSVFTAKFQMFLNYFSRVLVSMPTTKLTIQRQVCRRYPDWKASEKPLSKLSVHVSGSIEDTPQALHADFANQFIGGGVIAGGCVKEFKHA